MLNFSFVWVLSNVVVAIICWHERHCDVLHEMNFLLVAFCLTLYLIVFLPMICFKDVFLQKAMTDVTLNKFPNVLLIFNICQYL